MSIRFLDLFAGSSALSEGFFQEGFEPVAHVEMDKAACFTIRTRLAYHWLTSKGKESVYSAYLDNQISRDELYSEIPNSIVSSVINSEISEKSMPEIFSKIDSILGSKKLDLIIGGPPCQAYSLVGRSRDKDKMQGDKRNYLYRYYAEFLGRYQPKCFVFENVLGLLSAQDKDGEKYFDKMRCLFEKYGYTTEQSTLDTSKYGIPQARKRVILVGKLNGEPGFFPKLEEVTKKITTKEVFFDLPSLSAGQGTHANQKIKTVPKNSYLIQSGIRDLNSNKVTWHQTRPHVKRDLKIYEIAVDLWSEKQKRLKYDGLPNNLKTHKNQKSFLDRFKVVAGEKPSHTIVAHISKDGHYYIHPDKKQNRSLSVREAVRIQTFPDSFYFESASGRPSRTAAFKQIGNAVPVVLARSIAKKMKEIV